MDGYSFDFHGAALVALPSGAVWWPSKDILCVSDLHLGKSGRVARRSGTMLPPYENADTLMRLEDELDRTGATRVLCLGDSFDDLEAADGLERSLHEWLSRLMAGRDWIWLEGNHDPGPIALPGTHRADLTEAGLVFRHIATQADAEISGHFHPKARITLRGTSMTRPCFLVDRNRLILPAFGTYTGGLFTTSPTLSTLLRHDAIAILTGTTALALPMPRGR